VAGLLRTGAITLACCLALGGCLGWSHRYYDVGPTRVEVRVASKVGAAIQVGCADWSAQPDVFIALANGGEPLAGPIHRGTLASGTATFQCDAQHRYLGSPFPLPGPGDAEDRDIFVRIDAEPRVYHVKVHRGEASLFAGDLTVVPEGEPVRIPMDPKRMSSKEGMEEFDANYHRRRGIFESAHWTPAQDARVSMTQGAGANDPMALVIEIGARGP